MVKKIQKKNNVVWYVKIMWNSNVNVRKANILRPQPCPLVNVLLVAVLSDSGSFCRDCMARKPQNSHYLALYRKSLLTPCQEHERHFFQVVLNTEKYMCQETALILELENHDHSFSHTHWECPTRRLPEDTREMQSSVRDSPCSQGACCLKGYKTYTDNTKATVQGKQRCEGKTGVYNGN